MLKSGFVLLLLGIGFATFTPSRVLFILFIGILAFSLLAFWPSHYQQFEAWLCLAVIVLCGIFGAVRFVVDLPEIARADHSEYIRLYMGAGLIAGLAVVLPHVLLRLAVLTWQNSSPPTELDDNEAPRS